MSASRAGRRLRASAADLGAGLRFAAALPRFLRRPIPLPAARALVRERFERRAERLVARIEAARATPGSPYRALLDHAGCAPREVAELVAREGVEGALVRLFRAGVYLAGDELRGRRRVVRGSLELEVDPATLVDPRATVHGRLRSSGSRGAAAAVPLDLAFVADHAVNTMLTLEAHGGLDWRHAFYGVPGGTSFTNPLELAKAGRPPVRSFSSIPLDSPALDARYRRAAAALRLASRLAGVPLPAAEPAPLDDPEPIVRWLAEELRSGRVPHLWTYASSAVIVAEAARAAGVEIAGARFTCGGEPTTVARRAALERAGAVALPRMGATETDLLAYACRLPAAADDLHFFDDRHALIQPGEDARPGLPPRALLLTALLPTAPLSLVNACLGDQAEAARRSCGCGLEREGWTLHLREVRSFEKLTVGGATLDDLDLVRILEQVLPARHGGAPTDYQLVERLDGEGGGGALMLLVHPALGPLDGDRLVESLLSAIGEGSPARRVLELQWRQSRALRVLRAPPRRGASGKIAHLHLESGPEAELSAEPAQRSSTASSS